MLPLKRNLPNWERAARLALAVFVAVAIRWLSLEGLAALAGWLTAVTLALTAFAGFCPACAMAERRPPGK